MTKKTARRKGKQIFKERGALQKSRRANNNQYESGAAKHGCVDALTPETSEASKEHKGRNQKSQHSKNVKNQIREKRTTWSDPIFNKRVAMCVQRVVAWMKGKHRKQNNETQC